MRKRVIMAAVIVAAAGIFAAATAYIVSVKAVDLDALIVRRGTLPDAESDFIPLDGAAKLGDMDLAMETDTLAFYIDMVTASFAVEDRRSGEVWYSTPERRLDDPLANNVEKHAMASQLALRYYDTVRQENSWTSYDDSVLREQFEIKRAGDGLRVTYTFGRLELGVDLLPQYITEERFAERILANLDAQTALYVRSKYVASKSKPGFYELLASVRTSEINSNRMLEAFAQAGYTEEDLAEDNGIAGIEMDLQREYIVVPVEYSLEGSSLRVNIPLGKVRESANVQLAYLELLKFFGAGSDGENGYLLVPSGSGGLIFFNNGKTSQSSYIQRVYGIDPIFYRGETVNTLGISLPVYGIRKDRGAVVALIESGDAFASVNADVSGRKNSYNTVYPSFTLRETDSMFMSGVTGTEADLRVIQERFFQGDISVLFSFLEEGASEYPDMAAILRERMIQNGTLRTLEESANLPLYLSALGAVETRKRFIGVPYASYEVMTTFAQAGEIAASVFEATGADINMRLIGWFNKGINHTVADKVSLIGPLGGRKAFQNLDQTLESMGGALFPDAQFQTTAYNGNWGYSAVREAGRWMDGFNALDAVKSRVLLRKGGTGIYGAVSYINSPRSIPAHIDGFMRSYEKLGINSLSLRDLSSYIASDQRKGYTIDRESAKLIASRQMEKLGGNHSLMLKGSNLYALPYASHILDMPMGTDLFYIVDEEVPFYQMLIHGYIDYAGESINTGDAFDYTAALLKMLEYGASPHYTLTYVPSDQFKRTIAGTYYSTRFDDWAETIESQYAVVNGINNRVRASAMTGHIKHADGVYETVYANGISVLVNYTDGDFSVDGLTVPQKGYAVRVK